MNRYIQDPGYWANRELNTQEKMIEVLAQRLDSISNHLQVMEILLGILVGTVVCFYCFYFLKGGKK